MSDAIRHLQTHDLLYWEVKFDILKMQFSFPMAGFIHISGDKVRYVADIQDILPFSPEHYEDPKLAETVKASRWLKEWRENINNIRYERWRYALIMSQIKPFEFDTWALQKINGEPIANPPQGYTRVLPPREWQGFDLHR